MGSPHELTSGDVQQPVTDLPEFAQTDAKDRVIPAIGSVVCTDERTGRKIIRTSNYDGGKVFSTGFAPDEISTIFPTYDQ